MGLSFHDEPSMREAVGSLRFAAVGGSGIGQDASFGEERRDNHIDGGDYIEMVDIE
jgi:hypothetical protein